MQLILLTAFAVAALCSYIVYRVVGAHIVATQPQTTQVVVAASDIPLGSVLRDSDLGTVEIEGALPEGAITDKQKAVGRGVTSNLYKGEPILDSRLAAPGAGGGLAATIPPGMRASAIRVDDVVGVAGFVTPGMHVDVLISGNPPDDANPSLGQQVNTLLQNIDVLSAGTDIQKDAEGKPQQVQVVNLLVTPEQAEQLELASTQAHIQLVLRNPLDTQVAQTPATAVANLYGEKAAPPPTKARPAAAAPAEPKAKPQPVYVIQVYNGSKQSEAKFTPGEEKP
ncbi:MAG: Flp pilus assembly protein CpaB [Acidobacteriaceae bacterium]